MKQDVCRPINCPYVGNWVKDAVYGIPTRGDEKKRPFATFNGDINGSFKSAYARRPSFQCRHANNSVVTCSPGRTKGQYSESAPSGE